MRIDFSGLHGPWLSRGQRLSPRDPSARQEREGIPAERINLQDKLTKVAAYWDPKILAQVNDSYIKLVKVKGEYVWHYHDREDELFLVVRGAITVQFRDGDVELREGEFVVVPKGVEHRPVAREEADVLLLEPTTTRNTGNVQEARTLETLDWI